MTFDTEKLNSGREPIWIVELDVDFCTNTYGSAPCTATGAVGDECFQARAGCDDPANYDGGGANVDTIRITERRSNLPISINAFPTINSVQLSPTKISPGEGLGERGSVTITCQDFPYHDRGIDPYVSTRPYDPEEQGTFWGRFRARHLYYQNRIMRVKSGYITNPMDLVNNFTTRTFIIERISGPNAKGTVTITGKDVLKLADEDRAQCPVPNTGVLAAGINTWVSAATLSPAGIGDLEYAASGTLSIGTEVMTFTRVADALTLVRAQEGTTASAHDLDDRVQQAWHRTNSRIDDAAYDLITNFTPIDSSYITLSDWQTQIDTYMPGSKTSPLILEPTGVKTLLNELCNDFMIAVYFNDLDGEIKLKVYAPELPPDYTTISEETGLVKESLDFTDDPQRRISEVYIRYNRRDPTEPIDEANNYKTIRGFRAATAGNAEEYGEDRARIINSRFLNDLGDALRLGNRLLSRYRNNPRVYTLAYDMKNSAIELAGVINLSAQQVQTETGAIQLTQLEVLKLTEAQGGHRISVVCEEHRFSKRYGVIAPNTMGDYSAESAANQERYVFVSQNSGLMLNGDEGYAIL